MARSDDVAALLREQKDPDQIGAELGISLASVHQYIFRAVSENKISFTQVYLAQEAPQLDLFPMERHLEFGSHQRYQRFAVAEHYLQIREIEQKLHQSFQDALKSEYGETEQGWWRQGIPESIRQECVKKREMDPDGCDHCPYSYTTLMNLASIAKSQWATALCERVRFLAHFNQNEFLKSLRRLNGIRNAVMHPVRIDVSPPDAIRFVEDFHKDWFFR